MSASRVLCVCAGGSVRSGSVAFWLKMLGVDALTVGVEKNHPDTVALLAHWADVIWLAEPHYAACIPGPCRAKLVADLPTGPDVFGFSENNELHGLPQDIAAQLVQRVS